MWIYIFKIEKDKTTYLTSLPQNLPQPIFSNKIQQLRKTHKIPPDQPNHCICWSNTTIPGFYY